MGESGLAALRHDFGGSSLYVPCARLRETSPLARALGVPAASAIVDKLRVIGADDRPLGGFSVYIAAGRHSAREMARTAAAEAVAGGMTRRAAARLVGLSERTVQRAARRAGIAGQAERLDTLDAAVVAAYAEDASGPAMAARLGIDLVRLHGRLAGARRRTGLALQLTRRERPARTRGPSRAEAAAARDAAVIAAHAENPTMAGMAAHLGISRDRLGNWLDRARARSGLTLALAGRPRSSGALGVTRSDATVALDAAVVTAHAAEPTIAAMSARLGVSPGCMSNWLARARERTGLALALRAHAPAPRSARRSVAEVDADLVAAHAAGRMPSEIAARMGWRLDYVYCRFWKLRQRTGLALTFDRRPYHEELWGEHVRSRQTQVEACLREGLSRREIAARLGISLSTVGNFRAKLRAATGETFAPPPSDHAHARAGRERRSAIAAAFLPGMTLADLAARTGLTEAALRHHLARLRSDTGRPFEIARRVGAAIPFL